MSKVSTIVVAQRRASISSYLSNNLGPRTTQEIAASMPDVSLRTVGQMLGAMARNKLIGPMVKKGSKKMWQWPVNGKAEEPAPQVISTKPIASKRASTPVKEIELEIDGLTVIVGRNPATGRFRVILEG